jgi:hypothetical protein
LWLPLCCSGQRGMQGHPCLGACHMLCQFCTAARAVRDT